MMEKFTCSTCKLPKPVTEFSRNKCTRTGYNNCCKSCIREYNSRRRYRQHGLTLEQWEAILERQDGKCAICRTDTPGGGWRYFGVDHDHECCPGEFSCGKCVRGLLCCNCNHGLGNFADNVEYLSSAITYLGVAA